MATCVEVIARLGDTFLDIHHLTEGGYRLADAPIVELTRQGALARRPDGPARMLARGARVELMCGLVTVELALVEPPRSELPRPAIEGRPYGYALAALAAHLALWVAAVTAAPMFERIHRPRPVHLSRAGAAAAAAARPEAVSLPEPVATPVANVPRAQHAATRPSHRGEVTIAEAIASAARDPALTDMTAINNGFDPGAGIYDDQAPGGFGTATTFDPTADPRFAAVPTGRYATVAEGRGAGVFYDIGLPPPQPKVQLCATAGCSVTGGLDERAIRIELEQQLDALLRCYLAHAPAALTSEVVLELEIAEDGRVSRARGRGLGHVGPCVAGIASAIAFPAAGSVTRVRYPMTFQPR